MAHMHREINRLKDRILQLSSIVEKNLHYSWQALSQYDAEIAKDVIARDNEVNDLEVDIEEDCLKVLALYQPVATDLRVTVSILKINNDLERMSDLATNIAKYTLRIMKHKEVQIPTKFEPMFVTVLKMIRMSIDALLDSDASVAAEVCTLDDTVDQYNEEIIRELQELLKKETSDVHSLLFLFSACRALERVGDYATNIAEDAYYLISGDIVRHHSEEMNPKA